MKRFFSILTALALCLNLCPAWAFAAEPDPALCKHHPAHTEDCGFIAPSEGQPCGHQHTAECYTQGGLPHPDGGNDYEISADTENPLDCRHSHDSECGYVPANPGQPCGFVCRLCPIEDLIAALPNSVTEGNADDVRAQLDHILDLYRELDEDEQEEINLSRIYALQGALDAANDPMPLAAGTVNKFLNFCTEYSSTISPAEGSGYKWDDATKTLTLTDFHQVVSVGFGIVLPDGSTLVLEGENTIQLGDNPQRGVDCYGSLALAGDGALTVTSTPEYGAISARGRTATLTFDNYICKDLSYKGMEYTTQKTVLQCLTDKDKNILSSVVPAARIEQQGRNPFCVAVLANAFSAEYSGADVTLLRDVSNSGQITVNGDFRFDTDGHSITFNSGIRGGRFVVKGGTFQVNGSLTSDEYLFDVRGGTLVLEKGDFTAGICVALVGGKLEIPEGAPVTLSAEKERVSGVSANNAGSALSVKSGSAALCGGSFEGNGHAIYGGPFPSNGIKLDTLLAQGYRYSWDGKPQNLSGKTFFNNTQGILGSEIIDAPLLVEKCTEHKVVSWTQTDTGHWQTCIYCKTKTSEGPHVYSGEDPTCTVCGYSNVHTHTFSAWDTKDEDGDRTLTRTCNDCGYKQMITYTPVISVPYNHTGTVSLEQKIETVGIDSLTYKWENYNNSINSWLMVFTSSFTPPAAGQSQKYRATITTSGFEDVPKLEFTLTRELCHHENMAWTQVDSSSHKGTCPDCSEEVTAAHTFDENGNCVCGATLAVTLTNAEGLIYKGDEHKPGVSVAVNDKTLTENTDYTVSYTGNINAGENTATVTVTGTDTGWTVTKTFSIGKATPTITWGSTTQELTYTGDPAAITAPTVTLVNNEQFAGTISYSYQKQGETAYKDDLPTDTGTYTIKAHVVAAGNYTAADSGEMTLTINPSPVTLTFNDQTITYGGTPTGATANPASADIKYSYITGEGGDPISGWPTNAGTYTVTAKVEATGNYGEATATAQLTINKAPLTIASATVASKPYDAAKTATVSGVTFTGLVNGETLAPGEDYTASGEFADANAGTGKSVTITVVLTSAKANNYNLTNSSVNATGTITKADSSITKVPTAAGITYGQALSDSALTGGEGSVAGAFTWTDGTIKPNAGTAQFSVTFTPNDTNYNTATADVSVTVAKATPTLTAPTASAIEYGQKLSDSALTGGTAANPNGSAAVAGSWGWVNEDTRPTATGTFPVAFVPIDTGNCNTPANVDTSVTVKPTEPKITLTATPAQQIAGGKVTVDCTVKNPHDAAFSDSLPDASLTYRIGSGAEQALTGDGFNIPAGTAVGTVITITAATTAVDGKYTAATRTATATVTDKTFVTISGVRAQDGIYNGGTHNGYTGTPTASPYSGDFTYNYAKADGTALSGPPTNAGDYTVTISLADTSTYIGSLSLDFTISKASITIKANDEQANVGSARPSLTYTASGLASGDTLAAEPTLTCDADMNKAGRYTITASGGTVPSGGNYNPVITYVPGTLTVTAPTVHVTSVTLNKTSMALAVGSSERLTATVSPSNATNMTVTWTSSNSAIARVDNGGNVTAVSAGSATITVTTADGGKTAACTVTVGKDASTLTLTPSTESLIGGGTVTLTLTGLPTGGSATVTCSGGITVTKGTGNTWTATLPNSTATYTFTASYAGDASHDPASESCTVETKAVIILPDPPAGDSDKQFKLVMESGISDVPAGLKNIESLNTPEKLETVLKTEITQATPGIPQANTAVYNVALLVSIDGGATWTPATADDFPTGGLTVTLPYPSGTDSSYYFTVVHMFTTSDFGKTPGDTEVFTPDKVTNMAQGLQVVVTGLSPISVGWTAPTTNPDTPPSGNHGGGGWSSSTYAITVEKSEHGKVTSNRTNASSNSTVTLTVTPDSGYVLDTLTVTDSRGNEIKLTSQGGNKYTFTMPSRAVTVKASFVPLPDDTQKPCDGGADCPSHGFTDLGTVGTWYHEAVDYVLRNGLMNGYSNGTFGPNDNLSRAQFAQILFNKEGRPVVNYLLQYSDVADGAWYTEAIRWATSQGIVGGYGNGMFGPNDNITREQLAVMLWRYSGSPAATNKELRFNDTGEISGFALEAMRWAVENGVINGKGNGILDPKGLATRAQVAQMLKNFLNNE